MDDYRNLGAVLVAGFEKYPEFFTSSSNPQKFFPLKDSYISTPYTVSSNKSEGRKIEDWGFESLALRHI